MATVDPGPRTGDWDYAALPDNVHLGAGCWIESQSSFQRFRSERDPGLVLGRDVKAYTWTAFSIEPPGMLEVGDRSVLVGAMFMGGGRITLGRRVVVSFNVTIADCDFHPHDPERRRLDAIGYAPGGDPSLLQPLEADAVTIADDVWIGIGALVLKGVTIGAGARIAPGAVVTRDVPACATAAGNPARVVGGGGTA